MRMEKNKLAEFRERLTRMSGRNHFILTRLLRKWPFYSMDSMDGREIITIGNVNSNRGNGPYHIKMECKKKKLPWKKLVARDHAYQFLLLLFVYFVNTSNDRFALYSFMRMCTCMMYLFTSNGSTKTQEKLLNVLNLYCKFFIRLIACTLYIL